MVTDRAHSPSRRQALARNSGGSIRPGPTRAMTRESAMVTAADTSAATTIILGRLATLKVER